jgi:hypothetical protein
MGFLTFALVLGEAGRDFPFCLFGLRKAGLELLVSGLTLGGGYRWLADKYGLAGTT